MHPDSLSDSEILAFYLEEQEAGTDLFFRFMDEKRLRESPLLLEFKNFLSVYKNDIFHDPRNAHLRRVLRAENR